MVKQKSTNKTNDFDIIEPKDEHGIRYLASLNEELEQFLETFPKFKDLNIRIVFLGSENTVDYDNAKVPDESGSVAIGDGVQDEEIIIMLENVASITHEFGHMVDDYSINMGNRDIWSSDYKFAIIAHQYNKEIDKQIQNNIPKDRNYEFVRKDIKDYACQNYEIYARLFQQYYLDLYGETRLTRMKEPLDMADETARTVYQEHKELIGNYFDDVYYNVQFEPNLLDLNEQLGRSL